MDTAVFFHEHKNQRLQFENDKRQKKNGGKKYYMVISVHRSLP